MLLVALLPWAHSGERDRSSYQLLRSADRLDLIEGVGQRAMQVGFLMLPLLVGVVVVALALHHRRIGAMAALLVATGSVITGSLVVRSSLEVSGWPRVAVGLGLAVAATAVVELASKESSLSCQPNRRPAAS